MVRLAELTCSSPEGFAKGYVSMTAHNSSVKVIGTLESPLYKPRSSSLAESDGHVTATTGQEASNGFCVFHSRYHCENTRRYLHVHILIHLMTRIDILLLAVKINSKGRDDSMSIVHMDMPDASTYTFEDMQEYERNLNLHIGITAWKEDKIAWVTPIPRSLPLQEVSFSTPIRARSATPSRCSTTRKWECRYFHLLQHLR